MKSVCKSTDHCWDMGGQCVKCNAIRGEQPAAVDMQNNFWQFPSEFMSDGDLYKLFADHGFIMSRMISGSKSGYKEKYPDHKVVFNANIVIKSRGKVWYGDIDLTLDREDLRFIANDLKEPLYVLYEMDARFENENQPFEYYERKAVEKIEPH
jgi:hypothetical protein